MKKEKMYCPRTMGTFKMMFGFPQPTPYRPNKWKSIAKNKDKKEQ
tara:strand:+ start:1604 stop:1738 length:135 start_codon:yes stop_codon:yes gene_type:complete